MEVDASNRYRSRILREMNANRENPFNSPPSSTGSHGSITQTMSSVFSAPEGESTRKLNEDIARVTGGPRNKLPVNWEAAHRKWPEFYGLPKDKEAHSRDDNTNHSTESKENRPPRFQFSRQQADDEDDEISLTGEAWTGSQRTRAQMQPRVDDGSDMSSLLARSPIRHTLPVSYSKTTRNPSPLAKVQSLYASDPISKKENRRSSLNDALDRLRKSSAQSQESRQAREISPQMSDAKSSLTAVPSSPRSNYSPGRDASYARSFLMPDVSHLGDFVTGTLRFSGSMKNGVPIFVKHGKVHDQREPSSAVSHAVVDSIEVPEEEEKIFVSMDMIRDEIISLQDHYDKVQEYAAELQQQVEEMEAQRKNLRMTNGSPQNAGAYEKLSSQKHTLEAEVASLQSRLDQASRTINRHETEKGTLTQERDRAHQKLQEGCASISRLTRQLSAKEKELQEARQSHNDSAQLRQDNNEFGHEIITLQQRRDALEIENSNLADENDVLRSQNAELQDEMASVRMENSKMGQRIQSLLTENRSLRDTHKLVADDVNDLQDNLDDVLHELDAAREEIDSLRQQLGSNKRTQSQELKHTAQRRVEEIEPEAATALERTTHSLHDNTIKLKEKVKTLKQQMAQSRAVSGDSKSKPVAEAADRNMTSAYILPDITMHTGETANTDAEDMPEPPELTEQSLMLGPYKVVAPRAAESEPVAQQNARSSSRVRSGQSARSQRALATVTEVSFDDAVTSQEQQTKRRQSSHGNSQAVADAGDVRSRRSRAEKTFSSVSEPYYEDSGLSEDESVVSEPSSVAQQLHVDTTLPSKTGHTTTHETMHTQRSHHGRSHSRVRKSTAAVSFSTDAALRSCHTLSKDARRVLEDLCEHDCRNCIVCTRIASHQGVLTPSEQVVGKKRITVSRPLPVTDRALAEDATMRPSQSPGYALALVIKGLEDEAQHLKHTLAKLNAKYTAMDNATSRKQRLALAETIHTLLRQLEVKNDQIYSLFDVLEGQKAAGQLMTEEEVEMTVLNVTGMTVGDATSHSQQFTWEGIEDC